MTNTSVNETRGILDVPDISLLSVITIAELVKQYETRIGSTPEAICLPVTSAGGLTYESSLGIRNVGKDYGNNISLEQAITDTQKLGFGIYLFINPCLPYATNSSDYTLIDNVGDRTPKCCIVNNNTQEAVMDIIKETRELCRKSNAPLIAPNLCTVSQDTQSAGA